MGLFDFLGGGLFGSSQSNPFDDFQNRWRQNHFDTESFMRQQEFIKRRKTELEKELERFKNSKQGSGIIIDGECEDITNKRALPKGVNNE
jgi:hypothetical protein